jgi:hypothetical protein
VQRECMVIGSRLFSKMSNSPKRPIASRRVWDGTTLTYRTFSDSLPRERVFDAWSLIFKLDLAPVGFTQSTLIFDFGFGFRPIHAQG